MLPSMAPVFANPLSVVLFDSEILLINLTTYKDYWLSENFTALETTSLLHFTYKNILHLHPGLVCICQEQM